MYERTAPFRYDMAQLIDNIQQKSVLEGLTIGLTPASAAKYAGVSKDDVDYARRVDSRFDKAVIDAVMVAYGDDGTRGKADAIIAAREGLPLSAIARAAGVSVDTLRKMMEDDHDFAYSLRKAQDSLRNAAISVAISLVDDQYMAPRTRLEAGKWLFDHIPDLGDEQSKSLAEQVADLLAARNTLSQQSNSEE